MTTQTAPDHATNGAPEESGTDHREGGRAVGGTPEGKAGGRDDRGNANPSTPDAPDLSHVHESLRERVKDWTKEERDTLLREYIPKAEYTQTRQAEKAELRRLKALEPDAKNWQGLLGDDDRRKYVLAYDPAKGKAPEEPEPDFDSMTAKQLAEYNRKETARMLKESLGQVKRETVDTVTAPQRNAEALTSAASEWADEAKVDADLYNEAIKRLDASPIRSHLSPQNVGDHMADMVERIKAERELADLRKSKGSASTNGAARAASPRGGAGAAAPDARSFQDLVRAGKSPEDASFEMMLKRRGMSERELDKSLGFTDSE